MADRRGCRRKARSTAEGAARAPGYCQDSQASRTEGTAIAMIGRTQPPEPHAMASRGGGWLFPPPATPAAATSDWAGGHEPPAGANAWRRGSPLEVNLPGSGATD